MKLSRTVEDLRRREHGMTLPEVMVAAALLGVVMLVFLTTMAVIQRAAGREEDKGRNNDQARLAVEELDREIRSGNVLYNPALETDPGYMLRVYTQSNAPTRALTGDDSTGFVCREWQVTDLSQLQTRYWRVGQLPSNWQTIAEGIVNRDRGVPPFALTTDPNQGTDPLTGAGGRTVEIVLYVNDDDNHPNDTVRIELSVTGRNTLNAYPANVCGPQG